MQIVDGELWGDMTARLKESLSSEETAELLEFVTSKNLDGYGEGLEQRANNTSDGEIYVSFWNHENYSLKQEKDMKNISLDLVYGGYFL